MRLDWFLVARDVMMILVLLFAVMAGAVSAVEMTFPAATTVAFLALTVGFCTAGCLSPQGRFAHLAAVATGVWLLASIVNSATRGVPVDSWATLALGALVPIVGAMLLGGLISLAFVRSPRDEAPLDESSGQA